MISSYRIIYLKKITWNKLNETTFAWLLNVSEGLLGNVIRTSDFAKSLNGSVLKIVLFLGREGGEKII